MIKKTDEIIDNTVDNVVDNVVDEVVGRPLDCPVGWKKDPTGLFCQKNCPPGYTPDALGIRCYKSTPSTWQGGETTTDLIKRRIPSPGSIPNSCGVGFDKIGALCYPKCQPGFSRKGLKCVANCPAGSRDDGLLCRLAETYGRGVGWISQSICESKENSSCEKCGLLWFPQCKPGFRKTTCNFCEPVCPSGWLSVAGSCQKPVQSGSDTPNTMTCDSGKTNIAGLCYDNCTTGFSREDIGFCSEKCPVGYTDTGLFCQKPSEEISKKSILEVGVCGAGFRRDGVRCVAI